MSEDATTVTGGNRHGQTGYFVEPTVITNTRPEMKIVREEIFDASLPFGGYKRPAGAARWATRSSRPTPRSRPSPRSCNYSLRRGPGASRSPPRAARAPVASAG
ncbi:MAG TPA: aldehyde dehydrogenase family protein [Streptosporangiaceae bacterium]|nr:aldehyde dehydrogenase family protein [Streptosporangiaceae bacterium]